MTERQHPDDFSERQLKLFAIRASEIAERVAAGNLKFLDGVDMLASAAEWRTNRKADLYDNRSALAHKRLIRQTATGWAVNHQ
jgi:hypothetical protein